MKHLKILILVFILALSAKAQNINTKTNILLVGLEEIDSSIIHSLPATVQSNYQIEIAQRNKLLKTAISLCWNLNDSIVFTSPAKAKALLKSSSYSYLCFKDMDKKHYFNNETFAWQLPDTIYQYGKRKNSPLTNPLIIEFTKGDKNTTANLPTKSPALFDLIYGLNYIQFLERTQPSKQIIRINNHFDTEKLSHLTLLINNQYLPDDLTSAHITTKYKSPFKIVSINDIEHAILQQDTIVALLTILPISPSKGNLQVSNATDGTIYYTETISKNALRLKDLKRIYKSIKKASPSSKK